LPNRHLTVGPGARIHLLGDGFYRAHSFDALFESLARHVGPRTIGVILSGLLKGRSLGLRALKEAGGIALVQRPEDASFKEMPENAIEHDGPIDIIGSVDEIADEICRRVGPPPVQAHRIKGRRQHRPQKLLRR
jgi:two-component system, chemotaxis family, protein-glutamate methylesterase/glutaminase